MSAVRLSTQQRTVLLALTERSRVPTTAMYHVRVGFDLRDGRPATYPIGEPVSAVLRRLERRGLVTSERGRDCKDWSITDAGLAAIGWSRS